LAVATGDEIETLEQQSAAGTHGAVGIPDGGVDAGRTAFTLAWRSDRIDFGGVYDFSFDWDGYESIIDFTFDIAVNHPDLSPASSAPTTGWAHWTADGHLVIAWYSDPGIGGHGVAAVQGDPQPDSDPGDSEWWIGLARRIITTVSEPSSGEDGHFSRSWD